MTGNLLFYFGLNNFGGIKGNVGYQFSKARVILYYFKLSTFLLQEPIGVIVLENCSVSFDEDGSGVFAFVVTFSGDQDRHVFSCFSVNQAQNWVIALRQARYNLFPFIYIWTVDSASFNLFYLAMNI